MEKAQLQVNLACLGQKIGQLTMYSKCWNDQQQRKAGLQLRDCQQKSEIGMKYKIF